MQFKLDKTKNFANARF